VITIGVEEDTIDALSQSGFSSKEVNSPLAVTAAGYAANILMAQLREVGLIPDQLDNEALGAILLTRRTIRERLDLHS
jgi:hypothetical protein